MEGGAIHLKASAMNKAKRNKLHHPPGSG